METRPYLSSVQTKLGTGANDADVSNTNIDKVDAGIELTVKPLIGTNGVVQLEISQKVDNFSQESTVVGGRDLRMPHIRRREAKSFVSVQSGDVLVLGGLKQRELTDSKKRMFFFGDLPFLGDALFSSKVKREEIKELIIFIRPKVLSNPEAATQDTEEYISNLSRSTQENVSNYLTKGQFLKDDRFETKTKKRRKERPVLHGKRLKARLPVEGKNN